jgi:hypothetical protein
MINSNAVIILAPIIDLQYANANDKRPVAERMIYRVKNEVREHVGHEVKKNKIINPTLA